MALFLPELLLRFWLPHDVEAYWRGLFSFFMAAEFQPTSAARRSPATDQPIHIIIFAGLLAKWLRPRYSEVGERAGPECALSSEQLSFGI
ncbi:MAG: hypothetical protein A2293_01395 [Elusimicrobia bacterium RIFOXYB2_FULL_49_7]|nr:MAG: hypothetical protein A2293_01395 [Elusimicrobia bacterium RIFOXYB2_FULL_49_7]